MRKLICDSCKEKIKPDEFIAVLAKSPTKAYLGRTESVIKKWVKTTDGTIYCKTCFENKFETV